MIGLLRALMIGRPRAAAGHRYWRLLANDASWVAYLGSYTHFQTLFTLQFYEGATTGTDLCLSGTAQASSYFNSPDPTYNAAKANDGNNTTTRWATAGNATTPQSWWVDLGAGVRKDVRGVGFIPFSTAYHAKSYLLQWSDDGVSWTTKATINTANAGTTRQTFENL